MSEIQNSDITFTRENVLKMLSTLHNLFDETSRLYNQYDNQPAPNSIAYKEQSSFKDNELIKDVHYRGILSMEAAADHLMGFTDSVTEPSKTLAPWTCVRGLLESCALATWFLDPAIDSKVRVGRCFAFRYAGFVQQIKFLQVGKRQNEIDKVHKRINKVEKDALNLGYAKLVGKNGMVNGIAQHMPNITELIGKMLDREAEYRLLSAIAHGHHWATHQIGFRVIEKKNPNGIMEPALEKHLHPNFVMFAAMVSVTSFTRVIWYLWHLYGWNLEEISHLLDTTYDQLNFNRKLRFWHATPNKI